MSDEGFRRQASPSPGPRPADGALTKARLAECLFEEVGLNKTEAVEFVEQFFEAMRVTLAANEPVKLSGFGNFALRDKRERPGRNPKTGKEVPVSARRVVTFHAGLKLRRRVEAHVVHAPE